jgi:hypothetical protein
MPSMRRVIAAIAGDDLAAVVTMAWKTGTGIVDKRVLDPTRPVMRSLGERIGGGLSPIEREMAPTSRLKWKTKSK